MATIQQRANADGSISYRAIVRKKTFSGSATFETEDLAAAWATETEARADAGDIDAGEALTLSSSVHSLIRKYKAEITPRKKGATKEANMLDLLAYRYKALFAKPIGAFTPEDAQFILDTRLNGTDKYAPVTGDTVRRNAVLLSSIFNMGRKRWKLKIDSPFKHVARPKANPHRRRRCSDDEAATICAAFKYTPYTPPQTMGHYAAWAFMFARETAMRRGEIRAMLKGHVNLSAKKVHLPHTKNGYERDVPLNTRARQMLEVLPGMKSTNPDAPLIPLDDTQLNNAWQRGKQKTSLTDLRFHDTRHEACTRMAAKVLNVLELASITGHKRLDELMTYFNPEAHELADRLD